MSIAHILRKPAATETATAKEASPNRWRWLKDAAREPFLHFILLGSAIFALSETVEHFVTQYRVVVGPERVARLKETYVQQFGVAPTDTQLKTLVDGYIKEEIEYRESLALGLDRDDEIVRRRLVQKYEFLQQDLQLLDDPSDKDLRAYYDAHRADYTQAAKRSFTQVYFSPDTAGEDDAHARAEAAFKRLKASGEARAPSSGDPFPGPDDVADLTPGDAERLFGSSDLSRAIFTAPEGQWVGPYRSGFGWHLLRITGSAAAVPQPFEAVRATVLEDWKNAQRTSLNGKALLDLKRKYQVVIPGSAK
jgi:hypothetical protein